jgi:hypothetical protein
MSMHVELVRWLRRDRHYFGASATVKFSVTPVAKALKRRDECDIMLPDGLDSWAGMLICP